MTNTCSAGYMENIAGVKGCDASIKGFFDNAVHATSTIVPGVSGTLALIIGNGGPTFTMTARCESLKLDLAAKGAVGFEATWKSNGSFSLPS